MSTRIAANIRTARNGYIVELRWPYGGEPAGCGEVVFTDWPSVLLALTKATPDLDEDMAKELDAALSNLRDKWT